MNNVPISDDSFTRDQGRSVIWLRRFSKFLVASTCLLIFAGAMVTSTGSGLAVPDWPQTFGHFMFAFPLKDMVGGIFFEHGHRMIASVVGFLMIIQAVWITKVESRSWLKKTAWFALLLVIIQGLLGGLTVLFFLPAPISVAHAIMAQTFFLLTIFMAYSLSKERLSRVTGAGDSLPLLKRSGLWAMIFIYVQLLLGAIMRHTESGLAVPDFPTVGGKLWPDFSQEMIATIQRWRFQHELPFVSHFQIISHLAHRYFAFAVLFMVGLYAFNVSRQTPHRRLAFFARFVLLLLITQVILGILTIWMGRTPVMTSFHVVTGATLLASTFLLVLKASPISWRSWRAQ